MDESEGEREDSLRGSRGGRRRETRRDSRAARGKRKRERETEEIGLSCAKKVKSKSSN